MEKAEFEQRIQAIQQSYLASLGLTVIEFRTHWKTMLRSDQPELNLQGLKDRAHKLAGSANTFQLIDISKHARSLQKWLDSLTLQHLLEYDAEFEKKMQILDKMILDAQRPLESSV